MSTTNAFQSSSSMPAKGGFGGIEIVGEAQVIDPSGAPIEGLFTKAEVNNGINNMPAFKMGGFEA